MFAKKFLHFAIYTDCDSNARKWGKKRFRTRGSNSKKKKNTKTLSCIYMTYIRLCVCVEFRLIVAFDKAPKPVNGSTAKEEEEV